MLQRFILTGFLLFFALACTSHKEKAVVESDPTLDPHSFSRPAERSVSHLMLDIEVNFEQKQIAGKATWLIKPGTGDTLILDVYDLAITSVMVDGEKAKYRLTEKNEVLGQALKVPVSSGSKSVVIEYSTLPEARALQWLEPSQTGDKTLPFLFTQSQAILARTWLPCQDSPGVRFTYAARVKVPPGMMALMSAQNPRERNDSSVYEFYMELPVPSYLMALAVGNIERKDLSERVSVYAEPGMLAAAAAEFADTEKMIQVAESLYGSYAWGRYDMLVLPPSFPFGGMENPRLTFVTPTVVTGDRSLVSLIAHELAHSWSGNLVTNATWNDFWLNEGFTTYFELRIMEAMYGREYSEMLATISHQDMKREVMEFMESEPRQTCLKMHLEGTDPDEGVGAIAYDKGYHFLRLCEETAGRERWDAFVKDYFNEHKFQSTNTEFFLEILTSRLLSESEAKSIGLHEWIYETGLPDNCPVPQSARFAAINSLISNFMEAGAIPDRQVTKEWSTHEWVYFIRGIAGGAPEAAIVELDRTYGLSESKNAEIRAAWIPAALASNPQYGSDDTVFWEATEEFLMNVGRRKFLTPIYKSLILSNNQKRALAIYAKARPNYHSVSRETIDDLLGWKG